MIPEHQRVQCWDRGDAKVVSGVWGWNWAVSCPVPDPLYPTDRSGMEDTASVEQLQETLLRALRALVLKTRPAETSRFTKLLLKLPDLRTLNNLHSEKLLSFRIDAQ